MNMEELERKLNANLLPHGLEARIIGGLLDESRFTVRLFGKCKGQRYYTQADYAAAFLEEIAGPSPDFSVILMLKTDFEMMGKTMVNE
jgi:hypothetical protein